MLAFLGGTGPEGRGLALRLALAGEDIIIGSRDAERAATAAAELTALITGISGVAGAGTIGAGTIEGADNLTAAARADSAFITVPYEAQRPLLEPLVGSLSGKVVVNVIAPMRFERGRGAIAVPVEAGSAAEEAQLLLPDSPVVAAFQNVSAEELQEPERAMEGDVVVCADDRQAKTLVMSLVEKIQRLRPVDGGSLANAKYVEQITPLLVNINRIYKNPTPAFGLSACDPSVRTRRRSGADAEINDLVVLPFNRFALIGKQRTGKRTGWKTDRLENGPAGKRTGWKTDRLENGPAGKRTGWKTDRLENGPAGKRTGWKTGLAI